MKWKRRSKRQEWAIRRNWLIRRLRGAYSIFGIDNCDFMYEILSEDEHYLVHSINDYLRSLITSISKTKYKEEEDENKDRD